MKTREYFTEKMKELRAELKEEIKAQFYLKLKKGQDFCNVDASNCIDFENNVTGTEGNGIIDFIEIDDNIIIHPCCNDLNPIDLDCIENVHDLMLLHYISVNDLVE